MENYRLRLRLDAPDRYFVWRGNDDDVPDQVYTIDAPAHAFPSLPALEAFAGREGLRFNDGSVAFIDFDPVLEWTRDPRPDIDPDPFLDVWNIIDDFAAGRHADAAFERYPAALLPLHKDLTMRSL